jgi:hypothetical protein
VWYKEVLFVFYIYVFLSIYIVVPDYVSDFLRTYETNNNNKTYQDSDIGNLRMLKYTRA